MTIRALAAIREYRIVPGQQRRKLFQKLLRMGGSRNKFERSAILTTATALAGPVPGFITFEEAQKWMRESAPKKWPDYRGPRFSNQASQRSRS